MLSSCGYEETYEEEYYEEHYYDDTLDTYLPASIANAGDGGITGGLSVASKTINYLFIITIGLLLYSIFFIYKKSDIKTKQLILMLPRILFKKSSFSFELLSNRDNQGSYLNSYSTHRKYNKLAIN